MAQWQEVQSLANTHLEQVHQLYAGSALPMAVRQSLAAWIEGQNWRQAAEPLCSHARMLFHSLLVLLGERLGSLGSDREDFMLKHNLRKAHRDLQAEFEEKPERFANLVANLLQEERRILRLSQAGGQGGAAPVPSPDPESGREQQIRRRLAEFHTGLQEAERAFRHLEDLQDAFDFCYKVHYQPGEERNRDPEYVQELQSLQAKLQNLDRQRREVLAQMQQLLGRSETLQELLQQELGGWRARQQRLCLGCPGDTNLRPLETWFTELGQGLFQLRQLLRALGELRQKVTYARDPLVAETPLLEQRLQEQLTHLLRSAFVVEQQPSTPNAGKRPLVLRTAGKFSARARLLVRLQDRNQRMEARIHIDRDPPNIKGFRRFNILTSSSKTLLAGDSPQEGLVCDFQYLTLKEQKDSRAGKGKGTSGEGPLVVTEELHLITFTLAYAYCGLELELETTTLPFVIISNNNQFSSAWASILWFNMLSSDPKAQQFFSSPPPAPWPRLAEVLSWQFQSVAERGLSRDNLQMLARKLLGSKPSPDSTVAWHKFSKDGAAGFSFWAWLDGILGLLQEHLKQLWKNGLILGFVSRKQEEKLLRSKRTGTFLLRFSESVLGGVTFTWVEHHETGSPTFPAVEPYTASELASLALPDIIRDYHTSLEEKNPENPLKFLYPDTARDEAFGPFYSQRVEGNLSESQKYLNRRLIRVSSRPPNKQQTEEELVVATENLETLQLQPRGQGAQQAGGLPLSQPQNLGTPQVTLVGTPQGVATSPRTLQVIPGNLGTPQVMTTSPRTLQPTGLGTLQPQPQSLKPPQVASGVPNIQGTLQVAPGAVGTVQVLQVGSGDLGTLQGTLDTGTMQLGAVKPPRVPKEEGTLPVELRDLELLPGGQDMQELLQGSREMQELLQGTQNMQELLQGSQNVQELLQGTQNMQELLQGTQNMQELLQGTQNMQELLQGTQNMQELLQGTQNMQELLQGTQNMQELLQGTQDMQELLQGTQNMQELLQGTQNMQELLQGTQNMQELLQGTQDMQELLQGTQNVQELLQGTQNVQELLQGTQNVQELLQGSQDMQKLLHGNQNMQELLQGTQNMQELLQGTQNVQELLQGTQNMQELLQSLEPGLGTLGTLGVAELMPDVVPALEESFQLSPGGAALLDQHDPFLPQPEDSALPAVPSLFTDFPPLQIDASDFQ